jgi:hypothetical protein
LLAFEFEVHHHHASRGARAGLSVAMYTGNFGVLKKRYVKIHGFFGFVVEP